MPTRTQSGLVWHAIEQLSQAAERHAEGFSGLHHIIHLGVLGGTVTHLLKMASAKDITEYRRGFARVLDLPYNRQELTSTSRPA